MPNKHNSSRRHHIPKMKFRVKNWAEYDAGLRRRGSLTLWVTPEVLDGWQAVRRTTPGGQSSLGIGHGSNASYAPRVCKSQSDISLARGSRCFSLS
jgi:hypothetical protein